MIKVHDMTLGAEARAREKAVDMAITYAINRDLDNKFLTVMDSCLSGHGLETFFTKQ
jgi:hypothetical protein